MTPFGNMLNQVEGVNNPWKFVDRYFDTSTNLYKFGTRYYDLTLGRWTQQDSVGGSLGNPDSLNRYLYAGDDPVNLTDPSGKQGLPSTINITASPSCLLGILAALGAIITADAGFYPIVAAFIALGPPGWLAAVPLILIAAGSGTYAALQILKTACP